MEQRKKTGTNRQIQNWTLKLLPHATGKHYNPNFAFFHLLYSKFKIVAEYIIAQNSLNSIWSVKSEKWRNPEVTESAKVQPLVYLIRVHPAGVTITNAN